MTSIFILYILYNMRRLENWIFHLSRRLLALFELIQSVASRARVAVLARHFGAAVAYLAPRHQVMVQLSVTRR